MLCSRLLYLWETPTVWRVVLWKRWRWWWWRLWQCSLYPGSRQERPRTEGRWGSHSEPKFWRVPHPLMSTADSLWAQRHFSPQQNRTFFLFCFVVFLSLVPSLRYRQVWCCVPVMSQTPSYWSSIPASVLLLLWKTLSSMDYWIGLTDNAAVLFNS